MPDGYIVQSLKQTNHPENDMNTESQAQSDRDSANHMWSMLTSSKRLDVLALPDTLRDLVRKHANTIARAAGAGAATKIVIGTDDRVIVRLPAGNRKKSDGSYVSNAYMNKGWSSCYHQHSVCEVEIDARSVLLA